MLQVIDNHGELFLIAVDRKEAQRLSLKVRRVLMEHSSNDKMSVLQFQSVYQTMFGESINIETMQEKLSETIKVIIDRILMIFFVIAKCVFRLSRLNSEKNMYS